MSPYQIKQKDKRRKNLFRKWHRRIGFAALIFLLNLSITGILLNHTDDLQLHKSYVTNDWLLDWYGIQPPSTVVCSKIDLNGKSICQMDSFIFLGEKILIENARQLIGLVKYEDLIFIATTNKVYIYSSQFDLVEISNSPYFEESIDSINIVNLSTTELKPFNQIAVDTGERILTFDMDNFTWQPVLKLTLENKNSSMLTNHSVNAGEKFKNMARSYSHKQITQLKFIQDLHSGQLFGITGKLITDLTGLIVIILALSGFFAWQRRKEKLN